MRNTSHQPRSAGMFGRLVAKRHGRLLTKCQRLVLSWQASDRRGSIAVLAAAVMVLIMAFAALSLDVGYIALTKSQLQIAADSAALAAAAEFPAGLVSTSSSSATAVAAAAQGSAEMLAASNRAAERAEVYLNPTRDVTLGRLTWDATQQAWVEQWGVTPYNVARVTVLRDQAPPSDPTRPVGDEGIPLFFARVLGQERAELSVSATAALFPAAGFRIQAGSGMTAPVLPIALDLPTWDALLAGSGSDNFNYNPTTGGVSSGADSVLELNLYPNGSANLPSGNRGTVDLGGSNNSTNDLKRQILYGLNESDLSYFPNGLRTDQGPLYINGDTGLSAGIKDDLAAIIGQPRAIPIFTAVSGPGNNATYTVVKFVGIRILDVKLTGSPSQKRVIVQPAPVLHPTIFSGPTTTSSDYVFTTPQLLH